MTSADRATDPQPAAPATPAAAAPPAPGRSRRAMLVAALGGLGAFVASALGRGVPGAKAAAGDAFVIGAVNDAGSSQSIILSAAGGAAFTLKDTVANGTGVFGWSSAATGTGRGLYGRTDAPDGFGVQARHNGTAGQGAALQAIATNSYAILATSTNGKTVRIDATGNAYGIDVHTNTGPGVWVTSPGSYAVVGVSDLGIGVFGNSNFNWSGYFQVDAYVGNDFQVFGNQYVAGNLDVDGTITNSGGAGARIDHPLDPSGKYLQHSFVESPDMKNVYDGVARLDGKGEATISMPDWFEALNRDFRYQLTPHGSFSPLYVKSTLAKGLFSIAGGQPGQEVSWQVTGIRQDKWANANRIQVEATKAGADAGTYLHPELHGQPRSKARKPKHPVVKIQEARPQ